MNEQILRRLRKEIFLTGYSGGLSHYASSFSSLEILYTLYIERILKIDASNPQSEDRERLILSKGHASLAQYVILSEAGFFNKAELRTYLRPGTRLGGEANKLLLPGVEASTGSLGHGICYALGIALSNKLDHNDRNTYVILGDGECEEGSVWEAVMSAAHFQLNHLTCILDSNRIQKMGTIQDSMSISDWATRFAAFGFDVLSVDGHDVDALKEAFQRPPHETKPRLLLANTVKGKGVSCMENNPKWHFYTPNRKELRIIMNELNITPEELHDAKSLSTQPV